ncbi:MAG: PorV/PorQ family protein [Ignavibacteriales bacterium]|nr:PorV/PorQ family protein [Ignavibacteriales bacterium]
MKQIVKFFVLLLAISLHAQSYKTTGTTGFVFLEIPVTARSAALGEASVAVSDGDAQSLFTNPAAAGFTNKQHSFSSFYSPWFVDIKHLASSYMISTDAGVFSVGLNYFDFGTIDRTVRRLDNRAFEKSGTYTASAGAITASFAKKLTDKFSFGVSMKLAQEKIDVYSVEAPLVDVGVMYFTGLGSLRIAAVVQNAGVNAKYIKDEFKMPTAFRLGAAAEVIDDPAGYKLSLLAEAIHPTDNIERINTGIEFSYNNMIFLRGGYKFFYDEETYSGGIGLHTNSIVPAEIDFAIADYGRLGMVLRFGVQIGVGL